jgi:hypothetical protein
MSHGTTLGPAASTRTPPACGFVDGAKKRRPQPHRLNKSKNTPAYEPDLCSDHPLEIEKKQLI